MPNGMQMAKNGRSATIFGHLHSVRHRSPATMLLFLGPAKSKVTVFLRQRKYFSVRVSSFAASFGGSRLARLWP